MKECKDLLTAVERGILDGLLSCREGVKEYKDLLTAVERGILNGLHLDTEYWKGVHAFMGVVKNYQYPCLGSR